MLLPNMVFVAFFYGLCIVYYTLPSAQALTLREQVVVEKPLVRLKDLFLDLPPEKDEQTVCPAPAPGKSETLSKKRLQEIVKRFDLSLTPYRAVKVTRVGHFIPDTLFLHSLKEQLRPQVQTIENFTLHIDPLGQAPFPIEPTTETTLRDVRLCSQSLTFSALLLFSEHQDFVLPVKGKLIPLKLLPTLKATLARGAVIHDKDVELKLLKATFHPQDTILDPKELVGSTVMARTLPAGHPVRARDVVFSGALVAGQKVTVIFRRKNMEITLQGKTLQEGRVGEAIRVLNPQTKEVITGTVGNGCVIVTPQ